MWQWCLHCYSLLTLSTPPSVSLSKLDIKSGMEIEGCPKPSEVKFDAIFTDIFGMWHLQSLVKERYQHYKWGVGWRAEGRGRCGGGQGHIYDASLSCLLSMVSALYQLLQSEVIWRCVSLLCARCLLRVLETFGTEPVYNYRWWKPSPKKEDQGEYFGNFELQLRQFLTLFRELLKWSSHLPLQSRATCPFTALYTAVPLSWGAGNALEWPPSDSFCVHRLQPVCAFMLFFLFRVVSPHSRQFLSGVYSWSGCGRRREIGQAEPSSCVWQGTVHVEGVCYHAKGIPLIWGYTWPMNIKLEAHWPVKIAIAM